MAARHARWRAWRPGAAARTATASGARRSRGEQLGVRLQVLPGGLRISRQRSVDDGVFQRQLDPLNPGSGGPTGTGHQVLAAERGADGSDRIRVEAPNARLEVVDLLDIRVVAGPHVGARQREQAVQLVAGVANQPAHRLVLPALRVVLDGPHVQTDQLSNTVDDLTWISQVPERGAGHAGADLLVTD